MAVTRAWRHSVGFFEHDAFLVETLVPFVAEALREGAAAVVIAAAPHVRALEARLDADGVDRLAASAERRYAALDAAETLRLVMPAGAVSEGAFFEVVGGAVEKAAAGGREVRAFAEMLGVLAEGARYDAALELEKLWNALGARLRITLFCAYPMRVFPTAAHGEAIAAVCAEHAEVMPTEHFLALSSGADRRRSVALLQQRAHVLEREMAERALAESRLEQQLRNLKILYALADVMGRASDLTSTCHAAVEALRAALAAERASILVFDDHGVMRFRAWRGLSDGYRAAVEGHSPWAPDSVRPGVILVPDVTREPSLDALRDVITAEGIRSLAFIPIVNQRRLLGKFMVYYDRPHDYGLDEVELARTIAHHVGFGVERARAEAAISDLLTRERAARGEAEEARAAAEAASRAKDEFLATLSHELRTPLTAIFGWVKMLRSSRLDAPTTARALEVIERNVANQAQLISDILDVSRIITGKMALNLAPVDLAHVVGIVIDSVRPAADAKGITITPVVGAVAPVLGDGDRLQQVLWNLLSNAVKFTPAGGRVRVEGSAPGGTVRLTVSDTGRGIAPEFLPYLFDRFRQADGSTTRKHGGLGLGLAIVRHLVELHGGTVWAESAGAGRGATFVVELPSRAPAARVALPASLPAASDTPEPVGRSPRLAGLRMLVVDDSVDTCEMFTTMLAQQGALTSAATSAGEALATLHKQMPDVLLCDIAMPGTDGYELVRQARARARETGEPFCAIAVTAYARPEDRARTLAAGFHRHVTKPVDLAHLIAVIEDVVARRPSVPPRPSAA